jgi:hypothetical protein
MAIYLEPQAVKQAAVILRDKYTDYDDEETKPAVSVFERAIERWFEYASTDILKEPDWWAYGPYSHLTTEFEHAMEWAIKKGA